MSNTTTRYPHSIEPVYTDGRDINRNVAELSGEAASQVSRGSTDAHIGSVAKAWNTLPEPRRNDPTYYDVPMLKEPVWEWAIPLYYYIGGLTGASLVLGAAAQVGRSEHANTLIRRCHWVGFAGSVISGALLVWDLGKPSRFLNMLRVFRPTSPMNIGAWILSGTGATATGALLVRGRSGWLRIPGELLGYAAGIFGAGLATYTGVLVANSAIPIWQESRKFLPIVFGSSALASLGCTFDLVTENPDERRITNVLGNVGRAAELIAGTLMEHQASAVPRVGRPFKRGFSAVMWRSAELLTLASLLVSAARNRTRKTRVAAGLLGTAGSLLLRYTVEHLGTVSARDARASFHQQREGRGAAEVSSLSEHVV
ncbi:MAG: NrfD/PsrC family molybdoenzyme membrane anchor subunit [Bryobacteraceae bacterium]